MRSLFSLPVRCATGRQPALSPQQQSHFALANYGTDTHSSKYLEVGRSLLTGSFMSGGIEL